MDEVDLLLHPLKSELNWPLGAKIPLDLTRPPPEAGPEAESGLRYQLTWQLADVVYYGTTRELTAFDDIKEARDAAEDLKAAMDRGVERQALQQIPHVALLRREYYPEALLEPLCRWAVLWLRAKRAAADLTNEEIRLFLLNPQKPTEVLSE
eukprot:gene2999-20388_t